MAERPDIVVLGLGPAGARAAAEAALAGCSVVALERKRRPGLPVQCAEFVPAMLDREIGGLDAVTMQRVARMATFVEGAGPTVTESFAGRILDRAAFDSMLVARAALAGADCRFGVAVEGVAADGTVALAGGRRLRPRLIVGADGPLSLAGQALGTAAPATVATRQIRVPLLHAHDATDIFLSADIPGGYAWLFPRGDECNLGIGVAPAARRRLKPLLEALHRRLLREGRVGPRIACRTGGPIPVGGMRPPVGRLEAVPVLLAGDAAGLANPVTGGGIVAAVQSGGLAGLVASEWLAGNAGALEDYEDELQALFGRSLRHAGRRRAELLAHHAADRRPGEAALRRGWIAFAEYWREPPNPEWEPSDDLSQAFQ